MTFIVYVTTNKLNGREYIGVHKTEDSSRFDGYLGNGIYSDQPSTYLPCKTALQCAVTRYGVSSFIRSILAEYLTREEANAHRDKLVTIKYIARPTNYNQTTTDSTVLEETEGFLRQYTADGRFLTSYPSTIEASDKLDIDRHKILNAVYNKHKADGYWFLREGELINNYLEKKLIRDYPVYMYSKDGDYIREYSTFKEIRKVYRLSKGAVLRAVKSKRITAGYLWGLEKYDNIVHLNPEGFKPQPDKVYLYNMDNEFILEWNSVSACKKYYPLVLEVLNGELEHCRNYIFSYNKPMILSDIASNSNK